MGISVQLQHHSDVHNSVGNLHPQQANSSRIHEERGLAGHSIAQGFIKGLANRAVPLCCSHRLTIAMGGSAALAVRHS